MPSKVAMAVGAHPDDIEFVMAGTLLALGRAGYELHYLNIANGCCGGEHHTAAQLAAIRKREGQAAAKILGAVYHASFAKDLEVMYTPVLLKKVAAVVREANPTILLVPSPVDYMEDHMSACRLAVTAAFARGMRNFTTRPARKPVATEMAVYHAMPHGLRDPLGRRVLPGAFVNTTATHATQLEALKAHRSQQQWLASSQGMNEYLLTLEGFAREMGRQSKRFPCAEGWRQHLHLGFGPAGFNPMKDALGADYMENKPYTKALEIGI